MWQRSISDMKKLLTDGPFNDEMHFESMKILESLRISILLISHLLVENFQSDESQVPSETPTISILLLQVCSLTPESVGLLQNVLSCCFETLQVLLQVLATHGPGHALMSPLVLQLCSRLLAENFLRFVNADASMYTTLSPAAMTVVRQICAQFEANTAQMLELLAAQMDQIIKSMPQEENLVQSQAFLMTAVAYSLGAPKDASTAASDSSSTTERVGQLQRMLSLPAVGSIFTTVMGSQGGNEWQAGSGAGGMLVCRLRCEGIASIVAALCTLASKAQSISSYNQICSLVNRRLETLARSSSLHNDEKDAAKVVVVQSVAALRGIACCQVRGSDFVNTLHQLFDASFPMITSILQLYSCADDVLDEVLLCCRDYAEVHLPTLPASYTRTLYRTTLNIFDLIPGNFRSRNFATKQSDEENQKNALLLVLQLLNHLANKDFLLEDEAESELSMQVADVLLFGLEIIVPILFAELFEHFPETGNKYFSFLLLLVSAYQSSLAERVVTQGSRGAALLSTVLQHAVWAAAAVDSGTARLGMQVTTLVEDLTQPIHIHRQPIHILYSLYIYIYIYNLYIYDLLV
jgi:hypothetical protein